MDGNDNLTLRLLREVHVPQASSFYQASSSNPAVLTLRMLHDLHLFQASSSHQAPSSHQASFPHQSSRTNPVQQATTGGRRAMAATRPMDT